MVYFTYSHKGARFYSSAQQSGLLWLWEESQILGHLPCKSLLGTRRPFPLEFLLYFLHFIFNFMVTHSIYYEARQSSATLFFMTFYKHWPVKQRHVMLDNNSRWYLLSVCHVLSTILSDRHVLNHLILEQLHALGIDIVIVVIVYR